jgi:hypothetical protein
VSSLLLQSSIALVDAERSVDDIVESLIASLKTGFEQSPIEIWPVDEVSACLVYTRDRVGVPRDISVHAANEHDEYFIKNLIKNLIKNYYEVNESNLINLLSKELQNIFENHDEKKI